VLKVHSVKLVKEFKFLQDKYLVKFFCNKFYTFKKNIRGVIKRTRTREEDTEKMEQQQCPICMLYLLPGMCLQDHLDTHPKDMIIKALLSVKTEPPKQQSPVNNSNEMAATTLFLTTPFNSSQTHIYQQQQQQQQQQQNQTPIQNSSFAVAKRNSGNNAVLLGNRPYRLTLDTQQAAANISSPTTTTFLNATAVAPNHSYGRRVTNENDLFASDNNKTAFRCIQQNTEQKNIMIVNTSSTQFSIQQTVPVKKQQQQQQAQTATAIELHPVIIDNSTISNSVPNAISIIPRYTSEKYSGPPPSYESSVTNTINDKPRVIDLTQTPTSTAMKMMEKQCIVGNGNSNNNNNNKLTTLSSNGADENRHLMITSAPQKFLEYTQTENGDFMITEKLLSTHHHHHQQHHHSNNNNNHPNVSHEEEIVEEIHDSDDNSYNVKFVEINEPLTFNLSTSDNGSGKYHQEEHYTVIEESEVEQINSFNESQGSSSNIESHAPKKSGVKVISNVKLTSAQILSPTMQDIINQYNNNNNASSTSKNNNNNSNNNNKTQTEKEMQIEQPVVDIVHTEITDTEDDDDDDDDDVEMKEDINKNDTKALIQCTETLNLSSNDKEEASSSSSSACTTSVIRKTTTTTMSIDAIPSTSKSVDEIKEQKLKPEPEPSTSAESLRKSSSSNVVFNSTNRLKQKEIYKQPKKLVVKLKKPLQEGVGECTSSTLGVTIQTVAAAAAADNKDITQIKNENVERETITTTQLHDHDDENVDIQKHSAMTERDSTVYKVESNEQFTVTFLDQHDYEPIKKITVTPEIHHDSETNQSVMSMELEPETSVVAVKREQTDNELPIIVKTEMSSCSASSMASNSQSSSCSRSPSRINIEKVSSININESSPINFLYQNDRVRFSPPLSPYVYMKTFSTGEDQPKQETDASWNNSSSVVTQNSDQNSTCSRYTPSFDDNRSNYTDIDVNVKTSRNDVHIRAPSTDSLNIRTDEKMPARGEISEQESNGEIEQPWHHPVSFLCKFYFHGNLPLNYHFFLFFSISNYKHTQVHMT